MEKKKMTFWQIFNMSFGFLGIQFGLALQNANVSRILQSFGASPSLDITATAHGAGWDGGVRIFWQEPFWPPSCCS